MRAGLLMLLVLVAGLAAGCHDWDKFSHEPPDLSAGVDLAGAD